MSVLTWVLIWVCSGYASMLYAAVGDWWKGEHITLQDLVLMGLISPFAGGFLVLYVVADLFNTFVSPIGDRIYKWFEKESVLVKGRGK